MRLLKSCKGMSLIQVMIGIGLMTVIGLGIAEFMVTSAKVIKRSEIKLAQLTLLDEIRTISSKPQACSTALNSVSPPQQFNAAQAASPNGWNLRFNTSTETIENTYEVSPGLTVDRLYFKIPNTTPVENTGTERIYLGKAYISFNVADNIMGGSLKQKELGSFYIRERISDNRVVGCEREAEVPISEVCTNSLEGTYDPATGKCTLPPATVTPSGSECTPGNEKYSQKKCYNPGGGDLTIDQQKYVCADGYWVKSGEPKECPWEPGGGAG